MYQDAPAQSYARLRGSFTGPLHWPGDEGYDAGRRPLNPSLDPRPAVVAEALTARDIQVAVSVAREQGLPLAVQATGHGFDVACHGAVLLKTSRMARVMVDPDRRIARVGPGARWGDVIAAAAPFGLAPLSGSSPSVGVTGYTLGGGVGWLGRAYGFAADSVLRADVVTADGRLVTASADQHPELFWALRGGGGNFGVVTGLEFRLYPAAELYGGAAYFPIARATEVLGRYRDWAADQPDRLSIVAVVMSATATATLPEPVRGKPVIAVRGLYAGPAEPAERLLRPLREAGGTPLLDTFRTMTYPEVSTIGGVAPRHVDLFRQLPDAAIQQLPAAASDPTEPGIVAAEVRYWGGAMARPTGEPGPVGHRDVPYSIIINAERDRVPAALRRYATGGSFLNFLHDPRRTRSAYTEENYRRLAEVKRAYDPDNVFGINHNIPPAPAAGAADTRKVA
jgi:FAD/FMN-containing dehydrogenase